MTDKVINLDIDKEIEYYEQDLNDAIRHGMCVSRLSSELARELGLSEDEIHKIAVAGMIHDIGKLRITPYIYGRGNSMKIEEMRYVRLHAKLGADIVKKEGYGDDIADIILYHHENYDGSGYPFCLQGDEIPIGARIIRVCDVLTEEEKAYIIDRDRAYRKAFEPKTALLMVIDEVRHFDMNVFLAFQRIINTTDILDEVQSILKGSYKSQIS